MNEPGAAKLVVIVEDDPAIAEGLALNLKLQGYRTEVAGDGEAAAALVDSARPDLVPQLERHDARVAPAGGSTGRARETHGSASTASWTAAHSPSPPKR